MYHKHNQVATHGNYVCIVLSTRRYLELGPEHIYPTICKVQRILWLLKVLLSYCLTELAYTSPSANVSLDQKTGSGAHENR